MRAVYLIVLIGLVVAVSAEYKLEDAPTLFEKFVSDYKRKYKDEDDKQVHYDAFVKNLVVINKQNAEDSGVVYGITQFADYTDEEWAANFGHRKQ